MAVLKCKMCGGDLDIISEESSIAKCQYCKTKQTIPKAMDENMQNIYCVPCSRTYGFANQIPRHP